MASSSQEPVVVLFKATDCRYCNDLMKIWDPKDGTPDTSVTSAMKKLYPKLRVVIITTTLRGPLDENSIPAGLKAYTAWYPMILLVPGGLWNEAMSKLGPKNNVQLIDGVQIFNGSFKDGKLGYENKYNPKQPGEFAKWLEASMKNEDFMRVQNGNARPAPTPVPAPAPVPTPTPTPVPAPANTIVDSERRQALSQLSAKTDVCSMRIVPRPR